MPRVLSGVDGDKTAVADALEELAQAIRDDNSHIQSVDHTAEMGVAQTSTESMSIEYTLTEEFNGIDPINHVQATDGDSE